MDEKLLQCLQELAESAEAVVHLITEPTANQKRLQNAVGEANRLLAKAATKKSREELLRRL